MTPPQLAGMAVGNVQQVLAALADPVRLEMVRRLSNAGSAMPCALLYDGINKSTATHHFNILRDAGLTERLVVDGHTHQRLLTDRVDAAMPGLLNSVVGTANREVAICARKTAPTAGKRAQTAGST